MEYGTKIGLYCELGMNSVQKFRICYGIRYIMYKTVQNT